MNVIRVLGLILLCSSTANVMAIEEPEFTVVETLDKVEIRRYNSYWVAQTRVAGDFGEAGNQAFRPLVDYLSGDNNADEKISMTAPVQQHSVDNQHVVAFVMPREAVASGLPDPNDAEITLEQVPAQLVAALRYTGNWKESRYRSFEQQLRQQLQASSYDVCGPATWARYNPPFWPGFLRRNEVLIPVAEGACETASEN